MDKRYGDFDAGSVGDTGFFDNSSYSRGMDPLPMEPLPSSYPCHNREQSDGGLAMAAIDHARDISKDSVAGGQAVRKIHPRLRTNWIAFKQNVLQKHRHKLLVAACIILLVLCVALLALVACFSSGSVSEPSKASFLNHNGLRLGMPLAISAVSRTVVAVDAKDGNVTKYVVTNINGLRVELISIGARVNAFVVPLQDRTIDIALGSDDSDVTNFYTSKLGAINGRVCSAIAPSFSYNGAVYNLNKYPGATYYVDGGNNGFFARNYRENYADDYGRVHFLLNTTPAQDGIQGNLGVHVVYELTAANELKVSVSAAVADFDTPVDLCSTIAFNLAGEDYFTLDGHMIMMSLPDQGTLAGASGLLDSYTTPLYAKTWAVSTSQSIKPALSAIQMSGTDFDFTYRSFGTTGRRLLAQISHETMPISLRVSSDQPAVRFILPNLINGKIAAGKHGRSQRQYSGVSGFIMQPQQFPVFAEVSAARLDSLMLKPGDVYRHETVYQVGFTPKKR